MARISVNFPNSLNITRKRKYITTLKTTRVMNRVPAGLTVMLLLCENHSRCNTIIKSKSTRNKTKLHVPETQLYKSLLNETAEADY